MKQTICASLFLLLTAFFFTSCQKEYSAGDSSRPGGNNKSTYYIKGKKDGVAFTYSANAMAMISDYSSAGGGIALSLMANAQASATNLEGMAISIAFSDGKSPAVGTYGENDPTLDYIVAGVYNPNSMTITWAAGLHSPSIKPLKINILTKTTTEITGTFEGAFYKQDASTGTLSDDHILFTECEFKLPVK